VGIEAPQAMISNGSIRRVIAVCCGLILFLMTGLHVSAADSNTREEVVTHYKRAEAALARGQTDVAEHEFSEILRLDPKNAESYANLGVINFRRAKFQNAKNFFADALTHNPSLTDAKAFLGLTDLRLGATKDGLTLLQETFPKIHNQGLKIDAGVAIIRAHQDSKTLGEVVDVIHELEQTAPKNPEVLYVAYRAYSQLASEAVAALSENASDSGRLQQILGEAGMTQDDFPGAVEHFKKAAAIDEKLPGIHYELGLAILTNSQNATAREEAEREFETALQADPTDSNSEYQLGEIAVLKSDWPLASQHYKRALSLRPDLADARVGLGKVLMRQGKPAEAIPQFLDAIRQEPENEAAHYRLSRAYRTVGRGQEADSESQRFQKLHQMHGANSQKTPQEQSEDKP
jgi:tetratricopeptide (TPR) repeat protein